jgi:hypothetical protein
MSGLSWVCVSHRASSSNNMKKKLPKVFIVWMSHKMNHFHAVQTQTTTFLVLNLLTIKMKLNRIKHLMTFLAYSAQILSNIRNACSINLWRQQQIINIPIKPKRLNILIRDNADNISRQLSLLGNERSKNEHKELVSDDSGSVPYSWVSVLTMSWWRAFLLQKLPVMITIYLVA